MFYKYRTDQNNIITAKSLIAFVGLAGNEAQVESSVDIFDFQPLYLYKVSGGVVVPSSDAETTTFLKVVNNIDPSPSVSYFSLTGYTAQTNTTYYKYNAGAPPTIKKSRKVFYGQAVTNSSGVATFEATLDGLSTGTAIFSSIDSIIAVAQSNTAIVGNVPVASVKAVVNGKSITVNVVESTGILIGGQGLEFSGAGITVYIQVEGE